MLVKYGPIQDKKQSVETISKEAKMLDKDFKSAL